MVLMIPMHDVTTAKLKIQILSSSFIVTANDYFAVFLFHFVGIMNTYTFIYVT